MVYSIYSDGAWRLKDAADWWILDSSQVRSLLPVTSLIHPSFFKGARGYCVTRAGDATQLLTRTGLPTSMPSVYTYIGIRVCVYTNILTRDSTPGREKWRILIPDIKVSASPSIRSFALLTKAFRDCFLQAAPVCGCVRENGRHTFPSRSKDLATILRR